MPQFNPFSTWFHLKYFKRSYLQLPVILSPEVSPAPNPMLPVPSAVPPATLWPHCSGGIPVNPDPPHVRWAGSELQPRGAVRALRRKKNTALPSCLTLGKGGPFLFFFFSSSRLYIRITGRFVELRCKVTNYVKPLTRAVHSYVYLYILQ